MAQSVKTKSSHKIFYGYIIVLVSLLIMVLMHGGTSSFGVFFSSFQKDFGWSRAEVSIAGSIAFFLMGLFATFGGRLTDKYGPKLTMILSGLILGLGYTLVAHASALWQLYVFYGVLIGVGASSADVALLPTTARFFVKRRVLMTSLAKVGTGIGIFVVPFIMSRLIVDYDWHVAYQVLAVMAVVGIISLALLLKRDPAQAGVQADGATGTAPRAALRGINLTLKQAFRTPQFWMLCTAYFMLWYTTQSMMVHIAPHSLDVGLSVSESALIVSAIGGSSILGRVGAGLMGDRLGTRRAVLICFAVLLTALAWLPFASGFRALIVFALIYGFAHGGVFAIVSPLMAEYFGIGSLATILGMVFFIGQTGGAVGPILAGSIFDARHSYAIAYVIMAAAALVGLTMVLLLKPVKQKD